MPLVRTTTTVLLACALALSACGDDDEPVATAPEATATTTAAAKPTVVAPASEPDDEEPAATTTAPASTATAPTSPTTGGTSAPVGDKRLRTTAREHAERRLGQSPDGPLTLLRSERDSRWALVAGPGGDEGLWAVWLRAGKVEVATADPRRFDPPAVPCDLRPAFSEPRC